MYMRNIAVYILIKNACQGAVDRHATFNVHFLLSEKGLGAKDFVIAAGIYVMCLYISCKMGRIGNLYVYKQFNFIIFFYLLQRSNYFYSASISSRLYARIH